MMEHLQLYWISHDCLNFKDAFIFTFMLRNKTTKDIIIIIIVIITFFLLELKGNFSPKVFSQFNANRKAISVFLLMGEIFIRNFHFSYIF